MESVVNYYYGITKKMLLLTGQWPYQKRTKRLFKLTVVTLYMISIGAAQVGKFIHCDGDAQCIIKTIPLFLLTNIILVKVYTCQFNSSKIKKLIDYLFDDWKHLETPEEYKIMKSYAATGRQIALIYSTYCISVTAVYVSVCLTPFILDIVLPLNESRPIILPSEVYYFVDEREYYLYIFLHLSVGQELFMLGVLVHDCVVLTYIEHACSIFAVAGFRFENIVIHNQEIDVCNNNLDKIYNKRVAISVNAHWRAIRFAELLENIFCLSCGLQLGIVTVGMSITLLQLALQLDDFIYTIRNIAFVCSQLFNLFCYNFQGQKLIDHSVQLRENIYNCSWYTIPVKPQQHLLYVMRRSLQPYFLSAGKIYVFSLKSFTTAVQTSMSYFTVLSSLQ